MHSKKTIIMIAMIATMMLMAVGYAFFSSELNINTTGNITSTWNIYFSNITEGNIVGSASNISPPSVSGTTAYFDMGLRIPGDSITYEVTLINAGSVPAIISDIKAEAEGSSAIVYTISGINVGDKLASGDTKIITIKIEYDINVTTQPDVTLKTLAVTIDAVQDVGQTITPTIPNIEQNLKINTAILKNNIAQPDTNIDFSQISSETNGQGLYYTSTNTEDNKTTYYFRGNVENNYVSFAGILWRIVRINEDGSVRLVTNTRIGTSKFNKSNQDNAYAGYMYGLTGVTGDADLCLIYDEESDAAVVSSYSEENCATNGGTWVTTAYDATHANIVNSIMKTKVDSWYKANLENYTSYLADAGFCNDRSVMSNTPGYGTKNTVYGSNYRVYGNSAPKPQFACPNPDHDLFTTWSSSKGNKMLDYPVGLMTPDEVAYAGVVKGKKNKDVYFYDILSGFATMSVSGYSGGVWHLLYYEQSFAGSNSANTFNVRPVINIKGDLDVVEGNGLKDTPYLIKTN